MFYPPEFEKPETNSRSHIITIIVAVGIILTIALALGLGLGIGLNTNQQNTNIFTTTTTTTTTTSENISIEIQMNLYSIDLFSLRKFDHPKRENKDSFIFFLKIIFSLSVVSNNSIVNIEIFQYINKC